MLINTRRLPSVSLEDATRTLQSELDTSDEFETALAPALVEGALTGNGVLLVVASPEVDSDDVEEVSALITKAGGNVTGQI